MADLKTADSNEKSLKPYDLKQRSKFLWDLSISAQITVWVFIGLFMVIWLYSYPDSLLNKKGILSFIALLSTVSFICAGVVIGGWFLCHRIAYKSEVDRNKINKSGRMGLGISILFLGLPSMGILILPLMLGSYANKWIYFVFFFEKRESTHFNGNHVGKPLCRIHYVFWFI